MPQHRNGAAGKVRAVFVVLAARAAVCVIEHAVRGLLPLRVQRDVLRGHREAVVCRVRRAASVLLSIPAFKAVAFTDYLALPQHRNGAIGKVRAVFVGLAALAAVCVVQNLVGVTGIEHAEHIFTRILLQRNRLVALQRALLITAFCRAVLIQQRSGEGDAAALIGLIGVFLDSGRIELIFLIQCVFIIFNAVTCLHAL